MRDITYPPELLPKAEDPDTSEVIVDGKIIRKGFACPVCGYRHPPDGMCLS